MEKRFFLSLALCLFILSIYPYYLRRITPSVPLVQKEAFESGFHATDETKGKGADKLLPAMHPTQEEHYMINNGSLSIRLSNQGGSVEEITLPRFLEKQTSRPIAFLQKEDFIKSFGLKLERQGDLNNVFYQAVAIKEREIKFKTQGDGYEIEKHYQLEEDYFFNVTIRVKNVGQGADLSGQYEFYTDVDMSFHDHYDERFRKVSILPGDNPKTVSFGKVESKGMIVEGHSQWVALQKKYFALFVVPQQELIHIRALVERKDVVRAILKTQEKMLRPGESREDTYRIYAGPMAYRELKSFGLKFEKIMTGGFWGMFRLLLLYLLTLFHDAFQNYGLAIVLLTITIKIFFIPLTHKQLHAMQRMQELQPKLKILQDQYRNEPQKLNKEVMELYRKEKVNPLGGCFPILLQMPIFIALYQTLSESVELRGAPFFGWIRDLSDADRLVSFPFTIPLVNIDALNLLPLLMTATMIWQQKLTPSAGQPKEQQNMMLFMSIIFGFIFYNLPSGLVLYWFLNNLLSIGQQLYLLRRSSRVLTASNP